MATLKRHSNGYIYLYHWIDRHNFFRISTKMKIDREKWDQTKEKPRDIQLECNGYVIENELIRFKAALSRALALMPDLNNSSVDEFKRLFRSILSPGEKSSKDVMKFMPYFRHHLIRIKEAKQSNHKTYGTCFNYLQEYFGSKQVGFEDIDIRFYDAYSRFLIEKNLATNTISNHWKMIKAVMHKAYIEGHHSNSQYRNFKRSKENSDSISLTGAELSRMMKLFLSGHLEKARDYFIVGAYTGLRYEDWDRVRSESIKDGILTIRTSKTDELSIIPIHPYVQSILKKWEGILPPKPSNQKMNDYIKVVAAYAKIEDDVEVRITRGGKREVTMHKKHQLVTTHTARRSLATNLILEGVSPFVVMKITGHKTLASFESYVRLRDLQAMIELKELSFFK